MRTFYEIHLTNGHKHIVSSDPCLMMGAWATVTEYFGAWQANDKRLCARKGAITIAPAHIVSYTTFEAQEVDADDRGAD